MILNLKTYFNNFLMYENKTSDTKLNHFVYWVECQYSELVILISDFFLCILFHGLLWVQNNCKLHSKVKVKKKIYRIMSFEYAAVFRKIMYLFTLLTCRLRFTLVTCDIPRCSQPRTHHPPCLTRSRLTSSRNTSKPDFVTLVFID